MNDSWIASIVLGIIEGTTEFLPVSSTGHLLIAERWLGTRSDLFNIVIQTGTVLALIGAFRERLQSLWDSRRDSATRDYLVKLAAAFCVTAVGGVALKALGLKLPETIAPVAWATFVGGVAFLVAERVVPKRKRESLVYPTWAIAVTCGLAQVVAAAFPGTSRSGITILVAWILGMRREKAVEISFLLGIPTLVCAGGLEMAKAIHHGEAASIDWAELAVATVAAAITAFISVRWLLGFVRHHSFSPFGWYRVALGSWLLWEFWWSLPAD